MAAEEEPQPELLAKFLETMQAQEPISMVLLTISFVLASLLWVLRVWGRPEEDDADPDQSGSDFVVFLITLAFSLLISRHILDLMGAETRIFELVLVSNFALLAITTALRSTGSFNFAVTLGAVIAAVALLRFSESGSQTLSAVDFWFSTYFPYEVTPKKLSTGILVFILTGSSALFFIRQFNERQKRLVLHERNIGIDPAAIEKLSAVFAMLAGLLLSMVATGVSLPTITVATGLLAAGVGFAAKDILSNIAAGTVLIWDGTFKVDDVISIDGGGYGWIDSFTLRHAVIKDRNDMSILIPYTRLIGSTIQNWTHGENTVRLKIDIGIDYETESLDRATEALLVAARTSDERVLKEPAPRVTFIAAGESAIQMQLRFWIGDPKGGIRNVMSNVLVGMINELKKENIKIPFNTMDVNLVSYVEKPPAAKD